jgi:hypothetical protein
MRLTPIQFRKIVGKRRFLRLGRVWIFLTLCVLAVSCGSEAPLPGPLNDIILHLYEIRTTLNKKPLDLASVLVDARHIEESAKALEDIYTEQIEKALAKRLQRVAQELRRAVFKKDEKNTRVLLEDLQTLLRELKAI